MHALKGTAPILSGLKTKEIVIVCRFYYQRLGREVVFEGSPDDTWDSFDNCRTVVIENTPCNDLAFPAKCIRRSKPEHVRSSLIEQAS
jgi:hypothetical protein